MSYTPAPNSVAARALAALSEKAPDPIKANDLARMIGAPSSCIGSSLNAAINAGAAHKIIHDQGGIAFVSGPRQAPQRALSDVVSEISDEARNGGEQASDTFSCGLFSDGRFHIESRDRSLTLTVSELEVMLRYLERVVRHK